MKQLSKVAMFSGLLAFIVGVASAQTTQESSYPQWVNYQNGEISLTFDQTPVLLALHVIHEKTGLQFYLPPSAESKLLNLRLERSRLEPAVHSLLSSIGFRNFALMYDDKGKPNRAVVLGAQVEATARAQDDARSTAGKVEPTPQPLTTEEHEKLQKDLEHWDDLNKEERGRIEDRLKTLPSSQEREELVKEYGRKLLGLKN